MAGVTVFAVTQWSKARSQARLAHGRELAGEAVAELNVDPLDSLALALRSAQVTRTSQTEDVLREALVAERERAILPNDGPVRSGYLQPERSARADRERRRDGPPLASGRHPRSDLRASRAGDRRDVQPRCVARADGERRPYGPHLADRDRQGDRDAPSPRASDRCVIQPRRVAGPDGERRSIASRLERSGRQVAPRDQTRRYAQERNVQPRRPAHPDGQRGAGGRERACAALCCRHRQTRSHAACRRRDDRLVQPRRHVARHRQPRWQRTALALGQRREPARPARARGGASRMPSSPRAASSSQRRARAARPASGTRTLEREARSCSATPPRSTTCRSHATHSSSLRRAPTGPHASGGRGMAAS